jgi:crotonobetainyl-CoA:carnitine CoA-transferase CaiB-like acyl-CoA transferase
MTESVSQHREAALPLTGVRILDLTHFVAGPWGTMMLSHFGAEVVKIEPLEGEIGRHVGGVYAGDQSAIFLGCNRGKKGVSLDLKSPVGRAHFERLVQSSDVVINNFRPDVPQRLGIDYASLKKINHRIITFSLSAFGPSGPYKMKAANDPIIQALTGVMSQTGEPDGQPLRLGVSMPDFAGGMVTLIAVLGGLLLRQRTGDGLDLSSSLLDAELFAQVDVAMTALNVEVSKTEHLVQIGLRVSDRAFRCVDGLCVSIAADDEQTSRALLNLVGIPCTEETSTPSIEVVLQKVSEYVESRSTHQVLEELSHASVPATKVLALSDVFRDGQGAALVREYRHPSLGNMQYCSIPGEQVADALAPPPLLGQHNDEFLVTTVT